MKNSNCDHLDDYRNGDLDTEGAAAFELHLANCEVCRGEVELDRRIGGLLACVRPAAPQLLVARIEREVLVQRRFQTMRRTALLVTAAVVLISVMWQSFGERQLQVRPAPEVAVAAPTRSDVRITFPAEANLIAMPLESKNPKVSIVWVYPALRVVDQSRRPDAD